MRVSAEIVHLGLSESSVFWKREGRSGCRALPGITHVMQDNLTFTDQVGDSFMVPFLYGRDHGKGTTKERVWEANKSIVRLAVRTAPAPGKLVLVYHSSSWSLGIAYRAEPGNPPRLSETEIRKMSALCVRLLEMAEVLET